MLDLQQKSTGTTYTRTVALLAVAFIFNPAALVLWRPIGFTSVLLAASASALCVAYAWAKWKKSSKLSIPTIIQQDGNPE